VEKSQSRLKQKTKHLILQGQEFCWS